MVDTQRITSTSLIAVSVGEVAGALAATHPERLVHTFEVASFFPLDVESVERVMHCLEGHYQLDQVRRDGLGYWAFLEPSEIDAGAVRRYLRGEHLEPSGQLMRQLAALARDDEEYRRTRDQHELLRLVGELDDRCVAFSRLIHGNAMTSARLKSLLNDFVAVGHGSRRGRRGAGRPALHLPPGGLPSEPSSGPPRGFAAGGAPSRRQAPRAAAGGGRLLRAGAAGDGGGAGRWRLVAGPRDLWPA